MAELPRAVYHVRRFGDAKKPYYGRSDRRMYDHERYVRQFMGPSGDQWTYEVHRLMPGGQWEDITHEF